MEIKKLFGKLANNSSVQSVPQEDEDEGIDFQRIRTRIKNTLTLPVDAESLGKSSGAANGPSEVCMCSFYCGTKGRPGFYLQAHA